MLDAQFDSGLLILTMTEGDSGNQLNTELLDRLTEALTGGLNDSSVRVILLRSKGASFCTGMDFGALLAGEGSEIGIRAAIERYSALLAAIYRGAKPVVCAVAGDVRAGGVGLVSACDIVVATQGSVLSLSEVLFGLIPANVLPYLLGLRVSPQKARYLVLTSSSIDAHEAKQIGLYDEVVPPEKMNRRLVSLVRQMMRSSPDAIREAKALSGEMLWKNLDISREAAVTALENLANNPAVTRGIRAFQEGTTPEWFSRFKPEIELFTEAGS